LETIRSFTNPAVDVGDEECNIDFVGDTGAERAVTANQQQSDENQRRNVYPHNPVA
jgi:hypothetical protein